jgi:hypothetical protein
MAEAWLCAAPVHDGGERYQVVVHVDAERNGDGDRLDLGLAVDALLLAAPP